MQAFTKPPREFSVLDDGLRGEGIYLSREELDRMLEDSGFILSPDSQPTVQRIERRTSVHSLSRFSSSADKPKGLWGKLLGLFTQGTVRTGSDISGWAQRGMEPGTLSTDEIIHLAGGPLPPEERRKCPQCGATISKRASWCQWCGARFARFSGSGESRQE